MIRLFVGLGNPGPEYEATRHNAGFWWVNALAERLGARLAAESSYRALAARVTPPGAGGPVWLLEPMQYMNRSGFSVAALARFFKIAPAEILVIHDELDLEPGQVKLKLGGSAAGHNGLRDIHASLGTLDFWRLRIGIGHPGAKHEVANWVLKKPSPADREAIGLALDKSLAAAPLFIEGSMDRALQLVHAGVQRPKPPRRPAPPTPASDAPAAAGAAPPGEPRTPSPDEETR